MSIDVHTSFEREILTSSGVSYIKGFNTTTERSDTGKQTSFKKEVDLVKHAVQVYTDQYIIIVDWIVHV